MSRPRVQVDGGRIPLKRGVSLAKGTPFAYGCPVRSCTATPGDPMSTPPDHVRNLLIRADSTARFERFGHTTHTAWDECQARIDALKARNLELRRRIATLIEDHHAYSSFAPSPDPHAPHKHRGFPPQL